MLSGTSKMTPKIERLTASIALKAILRVSQKPTVVVMSDKLERTRNKLFET